MLLDTIQQAFNKPVLIKGSGNKGTELTKFGLQLLEKYIRSELDRKLSYLN